MRNTSPIAGLFAILALVCAMLPAFAAPYCTDNWSNMASQVAANGLTPAKDLQQLAAAKVPGKLIKVSLCKAPNGYQYELVFLDAGGQLVNLVVDAKNPFPQ